MSNINAVADLSTRIVNHRNKVEVLRYKISLLRQPDVNVDARLDLEINGNKRGSSRHYLSANQALGVLETELYVVQQELIEFERKYKKL